MLGRSGTYDRLLQICRCLGVVWVIGTEFSGGVLTSWCFGRGSRVVFWDKCSRARQGSFGHFFFLWKIWKNGLRAILGIRTAFMACEEQSVWADELAICTANFAERAWTRALASIWIGR